MATPRCGQAWLTCCLRFFHYNLPHIYLPQKDHMPIPHSSSPFHPCCTPSDHTLKKTDIPSHTPIQAHSSLPLSTSYFPYTIQIPLATPLHPSKRPSTPNPEVGSCAPLIRHPHRPLPGRWMLRVSGPREGRITWSILTPSLTLRG